MPYDFVRKRLSILVAHNEQRLLITKGALHNVLSVCTAVEAQGQSVPLARWREQIEQRFAELSEQGFRTLGLAYRHLSEHANLTRADESEMTFLGFLVFADPPKEHIREIISQLRQPGIRLKIITGDNRYVAAHVATEVFGINPCLVTGTELRHLSDAALRQRASEVDVFAEVEPNQKELFWPCARPVT